MRMTFALFIFHAMIVLLIAPRIQCSSVIHDSGWTLKFIVVMILFISFFWIPIRFFIVWAEVCRYASIVFLIVQVLYILVGAYSFNDYMINAESNDDNWKHGVLLFYTILLTGAALYLTITCFFWFSGGSIVELSDLANLSHTAQNSTEGNALGTIADSPLFEEPDCSLHITLTIVTIVMIVIICGLRLRPDSSIFTSALVNCWLAFLLWSALASSPDEECNALLDSGWTTFFQVISHMVWTFITLFSLSVASASDGNEKGQNAIRELVAEEADGEAKAENLQIEENGETKNGSDLFLFPVTLQTILFQLILMFVTCHYSMIMTNWGKPVINSDTSDVFAATASSFWIKIAMQWLSFVIYFTSQAMYLCCPDRFE